MSVTVINAYDCDVVSRNYVAVLGDMLETVAQPDIKSAVITAPSCRYFLIFVVT